MSMVSFCIGHILNGPNEISDYAMKLAFDNPVSGHGYPSWMQMEYDSDYSIEQGIREKVIYKMIGPLLNVAGGTTEIIDLSRARVRYIGNGQIHVNVPDTLTGGREILSVVNVYPGNLGSSMMYGSSTQASTCGNGAIGAAMNRITNNLTTNRAISGFTNTSRTGRNSFLIRTAGMVVYNLTAKVILSYDEEFSIINPKAFPYFGELAVLGTKAYIYKNCRRGLKEAVQKYGYPLDDLQDEIDGYRDAGTEFMTFFNDKIRKVLAYADPKGVSDHLAMVGPRRIG